MSPGTRLMWASVPQRPTTTGQHPSAQQLRTDMRLWHDCSWGRGAGASVADCCASTPLHRAAAGGDMALAQLLVERGGHACGRQQRVVAAAPSGQDGT